MRCCCILSFFLCHWACVATHLSVDTFRRAKGQSPWTRCSLDSREDLSWWQRRPAAPQAPAETSGDPLTGIHLTQRLTSQVVRGLCLWSSVLRQPLGMTLSLLSVLTSYLPFSSYLRFLWNYREQDNSCSNIPGSDPTCSPPYHSADHPCRRLAAVYWWYTRPYGATET